MGTMYIYICTYITIELIVIYHIYIYTYELYPINEDIYCYTYVQAYAEYNRNKAGSLDHIESNITGRGNARDIDYGRWNRGFAKWICIHVCNVL